ncbi:hypothetical protein MRB53_039898 [Persea americana]|nr:hypothetical protein MRB53_039898 [Persea americana]
MEAAEEEGEEVVMEEAAAAAVALDANHDLLPEGSQKPAGTFVNTFRFLLICFDTSPQAIVRVVNRRISDEELPGLQAS